MPTEKKIKARGTREEVWNNEARATAGKLTKDLLMVNTRGKIVSRRQSEAAAARYPGLKAKLHGGEPPDTVCRVAAAPVAPPDDDTGTPAAEKDETVRAIWEEMEERNLHRTFLMGLSASRRYNHREHPYVYEYIP